jgi:hypothetical protein
MMVFPYESLSPALASQEAAGAAGLSCPPLLRFAKPLGLLRKKQRGKQNGGGYLDVQLAVSHDSLSFTRVGPLSFLLAPVSSAEDRNGGSRRSKKGGSFLLAP